MTWTQYRRTTKLWRNMESSVLREAVCSRYVLSIRKKPKNWSSAGVRSGEVLTSEIGTAGHIESVLSLKGSGEQDMWGRAEAWQTHIPLLAYQAAVAFELVFAEFAEIYPVSLNTVPLSVLKTHLHSHCFLLLCWTCCCNYCNSCLCHKWFL